MSTGKQTPLGVNVMSGLLQGKGFWINKPTAAYVGSSTSATNYTTGSVINNSCLYWLTHSINLAYSKVNATNYYNIINIGSTTIPAMGNSPPSTYTYTGSPTWAPQYRQTVPPDTTGTSAISRRPATQWGYIRLFPWQGYNEFDYNNTLALSSMYNDFCGSFISAESFIDYSNKAIMSAQNSLDFLKGTYSNMNDLTTADITNVSLSPQVFGRDLINLGKSLDLSTIATFGYPSNLLVTLKKYNALTPSVSVALLSTGLTTNEIDNISKNNNVTKDQQQKTYSAFLIITGVDLAEILVSLNCNTQGLVTLADLLNVKKMFPNSYQTLTVPLYNAAPGPTNSKTYYPVFASDTISPGLTAPAVVSQVGTIIPAGIPIITDSPIASPVPPPSIGATITNTTPQAPNRNINVTIPTFGSATGQSGGAVGGISGSATGVGLSSLAGSVGFSGATNAFGPGQIGSVGAAVPTASSASKGAI